jgi:MFS family permease
MVDRRAFILALGTFAVGTDAFVSAGILTEIARDLSATIENAGLVVSVFSISYALVVAGFSSAIVLGYCLVCSSASSWCRGRP